MVNFLLIFKNYLFYFIIYFYFIKFFSDKKLNNIYYKGKIKNIYWDINLIYTKVFISRLNLIYY